MDGWHNVCSGKQSLLYKLALTGSVAGISNPCRQLSQ